ncbi:MAG: helix-turn-helix domain-containing protein [Bacteroidaceae bacterium]|nr:helix-turn-helix domain-containing protein [Bacteroidaceae bacterium]
MKRIILFVFLLALIGCERNGQSVALIKDLGDTPYQQDTILLTYASDPERALLLLDSAAILGTINECDAQLIRANIFSKSLMLQNQDSALSICLALLEVDSILKDPDTLESIYDLLINISRSKANDEDYLHWATKKAELCRQMNEEVELLRVEAEIGLVMTHLGNPDEGLEKIQNSIEQLDKPGSVDRMDAFFIATKRAIGSLQDLRRYEEMIPLAERIISRMNHYQQHREEYAEDSHRLSRIDSPEERDRYIDFCMAQANCFLAAAYAQTGDRERAQEYLTQFQHSNYSKSFSAQRMVVPTQVAMGLYDEAMITCDKMVADMDADTMNQDYANILRYRATAAHAAGKDSKAFEFMRRHARLNATLSDSLFRGRAQDYAIRYQIKEQQLALQKAESRYRQTIIIIVAISLLLLISTISAFYFRRQRQLIDYKNHALVRMINEKSQPAVDNETYEESAAYTADEDAEADNIADPSAADDASPNSDADTQNSNKQKTILQADKERFDIIDATIRGERLYANPQLQRQDICDRFGISRITLNNMLTQFRGNASVPQYINSIRMEEALKLLREKPELSITAIAETVGFSPANFRKQFTSSYGMTPLEYRQNL